MASGIGGVAKQGKPGRKQRPYRKHRPLPAVIVLSVLAVGAIFVWANVAVDTTNVADDVRCTPQPVPPEGVTFTPLPRDALDSVAPAPPGRISLQVLNAGGLRGQAARTTRELGEYGFTNLEQAANDPAYPKQQASCHGQIRFGKNGEAAARTVSLLEPCLQLVRDNRADASVDLAIGSDMGAIRPQPAAVKILTQLTEWAGAQGAGGGEQAGPQQAPQLSPQLLDKARQSNC